MTTRYAEVLIIGAGMAGLGAAWNLTSQGFTDFLIIEATDRAGGRIKTVKIDGYILDLGAQWIHGKFNSLYEIASSYNLLSEDETVEGSGIFIRNDGHIADNFLVKRVNWEVREILEKCSFFVNEPSHPKSVKEFLDKEFEKCLVKYSDQDQDLVLQLYDWHIRYQTIDHSCTDLDTVSAKHWGTYVCSDELTYYNLKNGYQSLIDVICKQIPRKHFVFSSPVTSISLNDTLITVECSNENKITCKHIILTPSLGVLKEFKNICSLLPESLKNDIRNMGFHGVGKIFLIFQNPWWDGLQGFQFLWTTEDGLEQSEKWFRYITGFEPLSRHSNILMGFIGGEGVAIMEEMNEEEVGRVCIKQLRRFLKQYKVPEPIKVIRTKWLTDEWTRGSYCNISSKCDFTNFGPNQLAQPVLINGIPKIVLAGEAIHPSRHSTTHSAFESGKTQSNVLLEYIRSKNMNKV